MDQIMYIPRHPFRYLPFVLLMCLAFAVFNSGADFGSKVAFLCASRVVLHFYSRANLLLNHILWAGLGALLAFMWMPSNFIINATFVAGLMLYMAFAYIPAHYLACMAVLFIVGMYLLATAHFAVMYLTTYGNAAVMSMMYLTLMLFYSLRPPLRMVDE
jgi:hypothetical protein